MTIDLNNNISFAVASGSFGLQSAANDLTQTTHNIAQNSLFASASQNPQEFLANAVVQQLSAVKQVLPTASTNITSNLLGLSIAGDNAQASAQVLDTASDTVGTILDILA